MNLLPPLLERRLLPAAVVALVASGLVTWLSSAPSSLWWLQLVGWVPAMWALTRLEGWRALLAGAFVGVLSILILLGKIVGLLFLFMWVRWTIPRFRYDQVMKLGWQRLLPLAIANLIIYLIAIALLTKSV